MVISPSSISEVPARAGHPTGVYLALGSNLGYINFSPSQIIERALVLLEKGGDHIVAVSSLWTSKAWPIGTEASDYVNAVCQVQPQDSDPASLLTRLHAIEAELGRRRDPYNQWASRSLDLDLLDYNGLIVENDSFLTLPHPRIAVRDFVLLPLLEISLNWVHPTLGIEGQKLLEALNETQTLNGCQRVGPCKLPQLRHSCDVS
jgi:2-amino-4-hydroxy-6-hydroxymethyldihydropteridine diphosphokinase